MKPVLKPRRYRLPTPERCDNHRRAVGPSVNPSRFAFSSDRLPPDVRGAYPCVAWRRSPSSRFADNCGTEARTLFVPGRRARRARGLILLDQYKRVVSSTREGATK